MTSTGYDGARGQLVRRGLLLEYATMSWNVAGVAVLAVTALAARSVALAGFGLDSLIEIGASAVVVWELRDAGAARRQLALRLIGVAFLLLAVYLAGQSTWVIAAGFHARASPAGIAWTGITAAVMFALSYGKTHAGTALGNPVLKTEGKVTVIDAVLAVAVLAGLAVNASFGWWWADPAAGYVLVCYAAIQTRAILA